MCLIMCLMTVFDVFDVFGGVSGALNVSGMLKTYRTMHVKKTHD